MHCFKAKDHPNPTKFKQKNVCTQTLILDIYYTHFLINNYIYKIMNPIIINLKIKKM